MDLRCLFFLRGDFCLLLFNSDVCVLCARVVQHPSNQSASVRLKEQLRMMGFCFCYFWLSIIMRLPLHTLPFHFSITRSFRFLYSFCCRCCSHSLSLSLSRSSPTHEKRGCYLCIINWSIHHSRFANSPTQSHSPSPYLSVCVPFLLISYIKHSFHSHSLLMEV